MSQATTWSVPLSGPVPPDDMADRMDKSFDALLSAHSGSARPDYAVAGTIWMSTATAGKHKYYFFDGTNDRLVITIDTATGVITWPGGTLSSDLNIGGNKLSNGLILDGDVRVANTADATKKLAFDASSIATGMTRTLKVPDADVALTKWELIGDYTIAAGTAALSVTGLSAFRKIRISGRVIPSATANIAIRTSTNNGSSYDSGSTDYNWTAILGTGSVVNSGNSGSGATYFLCTPGAGNAGAAIIFETLLEAFNKAENMSAISEASGVSTSLFNGATGGQRLSATARNALQILMTSGTFSGTMTIEGIRG
ncbi:hypothetical protein ACXHXM_01940